MPRSRLRTEQIRSGAPLPFDTFDQMGNLLLRRGYVIESEAQLGRLVERGLFFEDGQKGQSPQADEDKAQGRCAGSFQSHYQGKKISVFGLIAQVHEDLESVLVDESADRFVASVQDIVGLVRRACALDPDACVATILLHRKGRYSIRRSVQAAIISELIFERLGTPADERLSALAAALTMNVAILDLQDRVYAQAMAPNDEQQERVRLHPESSAARLQELGVTDPLWLEVVLHHHETIDGKGYPGGLSGDRIRLATQVISLADRYAAMISGRGGRPALLPSAALREIFSLQGKSIEAALVAPVVKELGIYPPGCVVVLANGDIGVVVKRTLHAHQPVVRIVKNSMNQRVPGTPKRLTKDSIFAVQRAIPADKLGFDLDPAALWEESFEFEPEAQSN